MIAIGRVKGRLVGFDLELLMRSRLLIQANSGGGKSYLIRVLCELLFGKKQIIILDREGEFQSLREKYDGFLLVGQGGDIPADVRSARILAERLLEYRASAICDLYEAFRSKPIQRLAWVAEFLEGLVDAPKALWRDVIVVVDEAHQFCPQETPKAASMADRETISRCKAAMVALATVGRKRGLCAVWATQRLAKLDKDASAELFNRLVGMTVEDVDVDRAVDLMSVSRDDRAEFKAALKVLEPGQFFAFGRAISKERILVNIRKAVTSHPEAGSAKHASEPPPPAEKIRALLHKLADLPKVATERAKTEAELRAEIRAMKAQLAKRPTPSAPGRPREVAKIVETHVVGKTAIAGMQRALATISQIRDRGSRMIEAHAKIAKYLDASAKHLDSFAAVLQKGLASLKSLPKAGGVSPLSLTVASPPCVPFARHPKPSDLNRYVAPKRRAQLESEHDGNGEDTLSPAKERILAALLQFEQWGKPLVRREWLAPMASTTNTSGGFRNNLGALRSAGLIDYAQEGEVRLSDAGRGKAAVLETTPSHGGDKLKACLEAAGSPAKQRILQVLFEAYPSSMPREELAEKAGTTHSSGGFRNNLGALRSAGMIEYVGTGGVICSHWITEA